MKRRYHKHGMRLLLIVAGTFLVVTGFLWIRSGSGPGSSARRAWARLTYATIRPANGDIILPVAFDAQDHSLSCEVATLKMALAYRGVFVDEEELIMRVGTDGTPKVVVDGNQVWGDPDRAFVGNIDGKMFVDGYGVYEGPIARAGEAFRPTDSFRNWTATQLAAQISSGNPVIAWVYLGSGERRTWRTRNGDTVVAVSYEHTYLVYGLRGTVDAPQGFYVIDPIYGPRFVSIGEFTERWSALGQRGVIVY